MKSYILFLLFISSSAMADIHGKWNGWVYWTFDGQGPKCFSNIEFSETSQHIKREGGFFDCDIVTMEMNEIQLTKTFDHLIYNDEEVGVWTENTYNWTEHYSTEVVIHVSIRREANHMDYQEQWIEQNGSLLYNIQGRFFYAGVNVNKN